MNVLVVHAHPNEESFSHALRHCAEEELRGAGHDVRVRDLYAQDWDPRLTSSEWRGHMDDSAVHTDLREHFDDLLWCEVLVLVYPTWWGGPPAILKGWVDRVWVRGIAWELPEGARRLVPRLRHIRRLVVITTHGSSWFFNARQGVPGKRMVRRSLRAMCHPLCRSTWISLYHLDTATLAERERFMVRVRRSMRRLDPHSSTRTK